MPACVDAQMTVHDKVVLRSYARLAPPHVAKYGGKFLSRIEAFTCVDAKNYDGRLENVEFPDKPAGKARFAVSDDTQAITFRHAASSMTYVLLQEGGSKTENPDLKL